MTDTLMPSSTRRSMAPLAVRRAPPLAGRLARQRVHALLERLAVGRLELVDPQGRTCSFDSGVAGPRAAMHVQDDAVYARVLSSGDIGLAEAYLAREWTSPDLVALLELLMRNRAVLERAIYGRWWGGLVHRLKHALHRNSRAGSRRNIEAHYDLGNRFYRLWLDATMNYSSAWFDGVASRSLPEAQDAKMDRALDQTGVVAGSRVLEIGCGWGALAERAALRGAHLSGVTLSNEQLAWGQRRLQDAGLDKLAALHLRDYRDLGREEGFVPYDAVISIEMFEAVGRDYWSGYFETLKRCLAPQGRACIQSITIRDDLFERYLSSTDFIQRYVFPGGLLPSASAFRAEAAKAGLVVERELAFGADYARTLHGWRDAFLDALPQVRAQGYDETFVRLWDFYLAYCEAAFIAGNTDVRQFTLRHA